MHVNVLKQEDDSTGLNNLLEKLVICKAEVLQLEKNVSISYWLCPSKLSISSLVDLNL